MSKLYSEELQETTCIHLHSDNSPDGCAAIETYIEKAKENNITAINLSEHGSLDNIVNAYKSCKKANIVPLIGLEAYLNEKRNKTEEGEDGDEGNLNPDDAKNNHLVLCAKTDEGIQSLIRINNEAVMNGFKGKPRTTTKVLFDLAEDLIVSSACLAGVPARFIALKKFDEAKNWLAQYKERFKDDFYIELQINQVSLQKQVNEYLLKFAKELKIKTICAQDCHYADKGDNVLRIIKLLDKRKTTLKDLEEEGGLPDYLKWISEETLYMKTANEIIDDAKKYGYNIPQNVLIESLINNHEWKHKCENINWQLNKKHYNKFTDYPSQFESSNEYFESLLQEKFKLFVKNGYIPKDKVKVYAERLTYETDMLIRKEYVDYLLETQRTISDIIGILGDEKHVSVGRGSAAGSLAAYLLSITKIDPIKNDLIFERFLSEARSNQIMDIDV